MSNFPSSTGNTVVYCDETDVARMLQVSAFTSSTSPTQTQVREFIMEAQEEIDNITQHAWRERQVSSEFLDFSDNAYFYGGSGVRVPLGHRTVRSLSAASGDTLQVWEGSSYTDYLSSKTEGRANDYWLDYKAGTLFLRLHYPVYNLRKVLVSFRYGESQVPADIQKACALMVASTILVNESNSTRMVEGDGGQMVYDTRWQKFREEVDRILSNRTEFFTL